MWKTDKENGIIQGRSVKPVLSARQHRIPLAGPAGVEPTPSGFGVQRSGQLSYGPTCGIHTFPHLSFGQVLEGLLYLLLRIGIILEFA